MASTPPVNFTDPNKIDSGIISASPPSQFSENERKLSDSSNNRNETISCESSFGDFVKQLTKTPPTSMSIHSLEKVENKKDGLKEEFFPYAGYQTSTPNTITPDASPDSVESVKGHVQLIVSSDEEKKTEASPETKNDTEQYSDTNAANLLKTDYLFPQWKGILRRRTTSPVAVVVPTDNITDEDMMQIYNDMLQEDKGIENEAIKAFNQLKDIPFDDDDLPNNDVNNVSEGFVNRRAPLNPLASPRLGKYRRKQPERKGVKTADPALKNNPLRGRLVMTMTSTAVLLFVFLQSLCFNKVWTSSTHDPLPLNFNVGSFYTSFKDNGMLGPRPEVLWQLGGLNIDRIRNNGETFRIFWAMWMHSGWIHIAFNVLSQVQYFFMFEPDWGFWKCFIIFSVSGVTGNLVSAVANPCSTTVGSSGGLFGLMGAMIAYCIEFWTTIPRPACILSFSCIVAVISLLTGFTKNTDNWAHIGGLVGGLCVSLASISSLNACRPFYAENPGSENGEISDNMVTVVVSEKGVAKKKIVKHPKFQKQMKNKKPLWKCGKREWIVRIIAFLILIAVWITCFMLMFPGYKYQPPGQVTYSGLIKCCCCFDPGEPTSNYWRCLPCSYEVDRKGNTWEGYCNLSVSKKDAFNLKPQYQGKGLFEALGFERLGIGTLLNADSRFIHPEVPQHVQVYQADRSSFPIERLDITPEDGNTTPITTCNATVGNSLAFDDILPNYAGRECPSEIVRLSRLEKYSQPKLNFSSYFLEPLTLEDEEWLRYQEYRFRLRTAFLKDVVKQFLEM